MPAEGELALDSAAVGAAFAARIDARARPPGPPLFADWGPVAGATEELPEAPFVGIALSALYSAADGLDGRCEDQRQELNQLEKLLDQSGETGDVESWAPATEREVRPVVDLDGPGGFDVDLDSPD